MRPGDRVLELGCGGGKSLRALMARGAKVVGLDFARAGILSARSRNAGADFALADAMMLPFWAGSFDVVVAPYLLAHVPRADWSNVIEESRRVLRPGGRFLGETFGPEDLRAPPEGERVTKGAIPYFYADPVEVEEALGGFKSRAVRRLRRRVVFRGVGHLRDIVEFRADK